MTPVDLTPLREFGTEAERLRFPCIDVGGFIVPGSGPAHHFHPGKEHNANDSERQQADESTARQEARSAAGSREGSPETAAAGPTAYAVGSRLGLPPHLQLEELDYFHPEAQVMFSSSSLVVIQIPVGLFRALPQRARLMLEIPLVGREHLSRHPLPALPSSLWRDPGIPNATPDVRAWATWDGELLHRHAITSHHQNPDGSICACREGEWVRGAHPLVDYISYCITWIGKVLHEEEIGFWPGQQHCGPQARLRRNRPDEYCGCGEERRYRDCCMAADLATPGYQHWADQYNANRRYLSELYWQGRASHAPRV